MYLFQMTQKYSYLDMSMFDLDAVLVKKGRQKNNRKELSVFLQRINLHTLM
jgi:hypothetical protein